tara:strand:- start:2 stop:196 length:195 start_codon:yes stop_codon:yes gene_type:complete
MKKEQLWQPARVKAFKKGFDDGLECGKTNNPYENNGMCDEWWLYERGYEEGVAEYCRELESKEK